MGIRDRLARLLHEAPAEAEAVEHDGSWWTWGRLRDCAAAADRALSAAGVGVGGRVGLVLENRPEHVAVLIGAVTAGRCVVTLNPLQPGARLADDIRRSRLPAVIAGPEPLARPGLLAAVTAQAAAIELTPGGTVRSRGGAVPACALVSPDVVIEMLTSGTTGPAKRVDLTAGQIEMSLTASGRIPEQDRLLTPAVSVVATPMAHISGLFSAISTLYAGRRMVLMAKFALAPWVAAVERYRIRGAFLVPAALRTILDADVPAERLSSLRLVTTGSVACPAPLATEFFRRYRIRVLMTYGATEFAGAVAGWTCDLHEKWWDAKAGSVGRAYRGVELRVTGDDGTELAAGQVGHLEVRTAQSVKGLQEWVRTSDLARLDADGFLWIAGRADDAIIRGGFKVKPDTVRGVLESHPAVREAAVVGLPDERLGAVPVAAVEIEPGQHPPTEAELVDLCRAVLTPYELPKCVLLLDALPRTPATKISRTDLLEMARASLGR